MSELSPGARELLAAAREQLGPDPAAIARMRSGVAATAGKGAAAGAGATLAAKLGLATVVAAVAIGTAVYAGYRGSADAPHRPAVEAPRAPAPAPALVVPPPVEVAPALPAPAPVAPSVAPPAPIDPEPAARAAAPAPVAAAKPPRSRATGATDLTREVELIDQAMAALRAGNATEALAAIRRYTVETRGRGQLAEDAAAIEIEAACQLHDPTVAEKLAAFDRRYPTSAQRSRLSSDCP